MSVCLQQTLTKYVVAAQGEGEQPRGVATEPGRGEDETQRQPQVQVLSSQERSTLNSTN